MFTLGVTGGIGSGKTTVCRHLEALGARVFYADVEAKRIMTSDPEVHAEIRAVFGPKSYDAEGRLNRAYLAEQVFGDAEKLAQLNEIVHPRVRRALLAAKERAARDEVDLLVYEAALIFETGGEQHVDAVLVVEAPEAARVDWVVARDATTPEAVQARIDHQLPPAELRRRADFVIQNTGTLEELKAETEALYRRLVR